MPFFYPVRPPHQLTILYECLLQLSFQLAYVCFTKLPFQNWWKENSTNNAKHWGHKTVGSGLATSHSIPHPVSRSKTRRSTGVSKQNRPKQRFPARVSIIFLTTPEAGDPPNGVDHSAALRKHRRSFRAANTSARHTTPATAPITPSSSVGKVASSSNPT